MKSFSPKFAALATLLTASAFVLPVASLMASPVSPISYSMPNGDGQASGGQFNYWDGGYTGLGNTTKDGDALSEGLGKLTDGIVSTQRWDLVSNNAGTGEYVGWYAPRTLNPLITFNFQPSISGYPLIDGVTIQLDNSGYGGVFAPTGILIDGVSQTFTAPTLGTVGSVNFSFGGPGLVGASHTVQFIQVPGTWTFVSEISFAGEQAIPEPASLALFGLGLVGLATLRRR